jgi:hypothetical protein
MKKREKKERGGEGERERIGGNGRGIKLEEKGG